MNDRQTSTPVRVALRNANRPKLINRIDRVFSKDFALKFVRWSIWGSLIFSTIFTVLAAIDPNFALTTTTGVEGLSNLIAGSVSLSSLGTAVVGAINVLFIAIAGFAIYSKPAS
jgi:hypothetical protein